MIEDIVMKNALIRWMNMKEELKELKKEEMELRKSIVEELFPTEVAGIHRKTIDNAKVECNLKLDYSVNNDVEEMLFDDEVQSCIKTSYSLKMREYKKLDPEKRKQLDEYVTVKPAAPTLSVDLEEI